jgi:hypothetical protein
MHQKLKTKTRKTKYAMTQQAKPYGKIISTVTSPIKNSMLTKILMELNVNRATSQSRNWTAITWDIVRTSQSTNVDHSSSSAIKSNTLKLQGDPKVIKTFVFVISSKSWGARNKYYCHARLKLRLLGVCGYT